MNWTLLVIAGLFEIGWAIGLKYTDGFTRVWPTVWTVVSMVISLALLGLALKTIPVGTGYAVWTGVGAAGTAILGIILFAEPATVLRLGSIALIVAGIVGLKLVSPDSEGAHANRGIRCPRRGRRHHPRQPAAHPARARRAQGHRRR